VGCRLNERLNKISQVATSAGWFRGHQLLGFSRSTTRRVLGVFLWKKMLSGGVTALSGHSGGGTSVKGGTQWELGGSVASNWVSERGCHD